MESSEQNPPEGPEAPNEQTFNENIMGLVEVYSLLHLELYAASSQIIPALENLDEARKMNSDTNGSSETIDLYIEAFEMIESGLTDEPSRIIPHMYSSVMPSTKYINQNDNQNIVSLVIGQPSDKLRTTIKDLPAGIDYSIDFEGTNFIDESVFTFQAINIDVSEGTLPGVYPLSLEHKTGKFTSKTNFDLVVVGSPITEKHKMNFGWMESYSANQVGLIQDFIKLTPEQPTTRVSPDTDSDGIPDAEDNCPQIPNPDQKDSDGDKIGDACDDTPQPEPITRVSPDVDGDGIPDAEDNCPQTPNPDQKDSDGDKIGDACDDTPTGEQPPPVAPPPPDADNDGIPDAEDNCPQTPNPDQKDSDGDKIGDACDDTPQPEPTTRVSPDTDSDGIPDEIDNCPQTPNPDQKDSDGDKIGDACDETPQPEPPTDQTTVLQIDGAITFVSFGSSNSGISKGDPIYLSATIDRTIPNSASGEYDGFYENAATISGTVGEKTVDAANCNVTMSSVGQDSDFFIVCDGGITIAGAPNIPFHLRWSNENSPPLSGQLSISSGIPEFDEPKETKVIAPSICKTVV